MILLSVSPSICHPLSRPAIPHRSTTNIIGGSRSFDNGTIVQSGGVRMCRRRQSTAHIQMGSKVKFRLHTS